MPVEMLQTDELTGYGEPDSDPTALDPLIVERRTAAGLWEEVAWLGSDISVTWPACDLPMATLPVVLHRGWGVNVGSVAEPQVKALNLALTDGDVFRIRTARQDPETDYYLFEGFVEKIVRSASGQAERSAVLQLVHTADILRSESRYLIQGQLWLDKATVVKLATNPAALTEPVDVTALDCVFNPGGTKNCYKHCLVMPVTSFGPVEVEPGEESIPLPVFTHPHDQGARCWSWARVLMYLLYLPRRNFDSTVGEFTRLGFLEIPGEDGKTLTQRIVDNEWDELDPETIGLQEEPWARALLGKPNDHSIEGLTWLDALHWTLSRCGLSYRWAWGRDEYQQVRWGPQFYVNERPGMTNKSVLLPSPAFTTHDKSWAEVREQANVVNLNMEENWREVVNAVSPVGGTSKYEVTVELVPGWQKNDDWDVDPDDPVAVEAALAAMGMAGMMNAWAVKYNRGHELAGDIAQQLAGRLWGLNTWGAWDDYGRPWSGHPYHKKFGPPLNLADKYELFDFADVRLSRREGAKFQRGENTVRPRTLEQCLSCVVPRAPYPPSLEISFDAGEHWMRLAGSVHISVRDLRIFLEAEDLRALLQPYPAWPNYGMILPEAYIRGLLRMRITAGLEIDKAFGLKEPPYKSAWSLSHRDRHRALQRRGDWLVWQRDDDGEVAGGNSQFNRTLYPSAPNRPVLERNASVSAEAEAARFLRAADRVRHRGVVELPELVFPYELPGGEQFGYRPGEIVEGCMAEDGAGLEFDYMFVANEKQGGAVIAQVSWEYNQDQATASTKLQLEDPSRYVSFGREVH